MNPSDPSVRSSFVHLAEGGFHLQLTLQLRPGFNTNEMRAELNRMLLAERILRDHKEVSTKRSLILPDWLLMGVTEGLEYRRRSRPSAAFASVFGSGKAYGIEEILDSSPGKMDSFSRMIYQTSCCALVLTLIDQPEGGLRMSKFLNALASDSRGDRELINQWFPGIAQSKTSLEKWWSLQMANLSRPTVFENMGPAETAKALDEALTLRFTVESSSAPVVASRKPEADEEPEPEETKPRGIISRWFGRGSADGDKSEEKPKPEKKPEPKPLTDEELAKGKQQGFRLRNLFGGGDDDKKDEAKPEPKKSEKPVEKPVRKEEPKKEPEKKKEEAPKDDETKPKRPGLFTRMFSGGDKDKESDPKDETKKEKPAKADPPKPEPKKPEAEAPKKEEPKKTEPKESAAIISPLGRLIAAAMFPQAVAFADASAWLSPRSAHFTFLGFGKKKDKDAEGEKGKDEPKDEGKASKKKEDKPEPPKKEEKKVEPEKETKKDEKPASKPEAAAPEPAPKPQSAKVRLVPTSLPIEDYARVLKRSDARQVLALTLADLNVLNQHAHVLFRPVIAGYIEVVLDLSNGKTKDVDARLKQLRLASAEVLEKAKAVQSAVDTYEANHPDGQTGMFDDFLNIEKNIDKRLPQPTDAIGIWFEEQFKKIENK